MTVFTQYKFEPVIQLRNYLLCGLGLLLLTACDQQPVTPEDTSLPVLSISIDSALSNGLLDNGDGSYSLSESIINNTVVFNVEMSRTSSRDISFTVATRDHGTVPVEDYNLIQTEYVSSRQITIPANLDGVSFTLKIENDSVYDPNESFETYFVLPRGATLAASGYLFHIIDDDSPPSLTLTTTSPAIFFEGQGAIPLNLSLPGSTNFRNATQIECEIIVGTAIEGEDFINPCPISFPGNNQAATINLPVINDILNEGDEGFGLRLLPYTGPAPTAYTVDAIEFEINVTLRDDDGTWQIPGTAANKCVDTSQSSIDCVSVDGINYPSSAQDSTSSLPTYTATGTTPDCMQDTFTGLMWELKSTDNTDFQYADSIFSWYNPVENQNGGEAGTPGDSSSCAAALDTFICDTNQYVIKANETGLCGFNDWRLPTLQELNTLVNYAYKTAPDDLMIDTAKFPNSFNVSDPGTAIPYWTSTPAAVIKQIWTIDMRSGVAQPVDHSNAENNSKARIRLVRKL